MRSSHRLTSAGACTRAGKTLIARQIGKMLNGREPKVVNGPEVLNKYVGASEENIRKLFVVRPAPARRDRRAPSAHGAAVTRGARHRRLGAPRGTPVACAPSMHDAVVASLAVCMRPELWSRAVACCHCSCHPTLSLSLRAPRAAQEAEAEEKAKGAASELHVIIFDEIDAICKSRGSVRDGSGVHDTVVNQLLTKIDGVDALNNILLIGMTNRRARPRRSAPGRAAPALLNAQLSAGAPHAALNIEPPVNSATSCLEEGMRPLRRPRMPALQQQSRSAASAQPSCRRARRGGTASEQAELRILPGAPPAAGKHVPYPNPNTHAGRTCWTRRCCGRGGWRCMSRSACPTSRAACRS